MMLFNFFSKTFGFNAYLSSSFSAWSALGFCRRSSPAEGKGELEVVRGSLGNIGSLGIVAYCFL